MRATAYFVGNLTRDPELRQTGSGTAVANFDLAINSKVGDDEQTDYFSFVAWRKTAEFCQKYLRKGMKVTVSAQPKRASTRTKRQQAQSRGVLGERYRPPLVGEKFGRRGTRRGFA